MTGRWRQCSSSIFSSASMANQSSLTQMGLAVMTSRTLTSSGSRPSDRTLRTTSVSVKMPSRVAPSEVEESTSAASVLAAAISRAAWPTVSSGVSTNPGFGRSSPTVRLPLPLRMLDLSEERFSICAWERRTAVTAVVDALLGFGWLGAGALACSKFVASLAVASSFAASVFDASLLGASVVASGSVAASSWRIVAASSNVLASESAMSFT
mmetsp:Transcript_65306/g.129232  ORF Transcript_65306/g.129232 Transcript_65306/m.129232 type:complete len:211 (-) Transcript_65306:277-909(-)